MCSDVFLCCHDVCVLLRERDEEARAGSRVIVVVVVVVVGVQRVPCDKERERETGREWIERIGGIGHGSLRGRRREREMESHVVGRFVKRVPSFIH